MNNSSPRSSWNTVADKPLCTKDGRLANAAWRALAISTSSKEDANGDVTAFILLTVCTLKTGEACRLLICSPRCRGAWPGLGRVLYPGQINPSPSQREHTGRLSSHLTFLATHFLQPVLRGPTMLMLKSLVHYTAADPRIWGAHPSYNTCGGCSGYVGSSSPAESFG